MTTSQKVSSSKSQSLPQAVGQTYNHKVKHLFYLIAAKADEWICSTLENFWADRVVQFLDGEVPSKEELQKTLERIDLKFPLQLVFSLMLASVGVALRFIASSLEKEPFTYLQGKAEETFVQKGQGIKIIDWNICGVRGFSLTDGGITPLHTKAGEQTRLQAIIEALKNEKAEVISLCECFDYETARELYESLKEEYAHFYFNIGNKNAFAPNSTLFVASKVPVKNPRFEYLTEEMLTERAKKSGKGIFSFDVCNERGEEVFTKITTHMQHSEEPSKPTQEEKEKRLKQVERLTQIAKEASLPVLLGGDLNLDDVEWQEHAMDQNWVKNVSCSAGKTWGGDPFSTELIQAYFELLERLPFWKKIFYPPSFLYYPREILSTEQNLDHIAFYQNKERQGIRDFTTTVKKMGFEASKYRSKALSDHEMMVTTFTLS